MRPICHRRAALLALAALMMTATAEAQSLPMFDPTLDCSGLPRSGPVAREIGLPAALALAEQRLLAQDEFSFTLAWAGRESDPAYVPSLKRIIEVHRCSSGDVALAMNAIEAAGEPSSYFLDHARNWQRDDNVARAAFVALAIRGDSAAREELRAIAYEAGARGHFRNDLRQVYEHEYLAGLAIWDHLRTLPDRGLIDYGALVVLAPRGGIVGRGVYGDSLSLLENEHTTDIETIPQRVLRRMARAYPSEVERAIVAYQDTLVARFLPNRTMAQRALYLAVAAPQARQVAFPSNGPPVPPAVTSAALTRSVCIERSPGGTGDRTAILSYASAESAPVRVEYGPGNALAGPLGAVAPEVFYPDAQPDAPGRRTRIALAPSETVRWTLLGTTIEVSEASPRCTAP